MENVPKSYVSPQSMYPPMPAAKPGMLEPAHIHAMPNAALPAYEHYFHHHYHHHHHHHCFHGISSNTAIILVLFILLVIVLRAGLFL